MATIKITELPLSAPLTGNETIPIVQGGITRQAQMEKISARVIADIDTSGIAISANEREKLDGIEPLATKNSPDLTLLDRSNHSGTQTISTIEGLPAALENKLDANDLKTINGQSIVGTGDIATLPVAQTLIISSGATVWDAALGVNAFLTLTDSTSLATPINLPNGGTITLCVDQGAVGGKILTLSSGYKFSSGLVPTSSTGTYLRDIYQFITDGTNLYCTGFVSGISLTPA